MVRFQLQSVIYYEADSPFYPANRSVSSKLHSFCSLASLFLQRTNVSASSFDVDAEDKACTLFESAKKAVDCLFQRAPTVFEEV
jgi:hypothetical protein